MPLYINRFRRVRHADPHCRAIRLSEQGLAEAYAEERVRPPARFVEIPDPTDPAEIEAIRDFTYPCVYCVPGAREAWKSLPIVFESKDERDPDADWNHWAVVVRNEPSPSHPGMVQVVGKSRGGEELVIYQSQTPERIGETIYLDDEGQDDQADGGQDDDPADA